MNKFSKIFYSIFRFPAYWILKICYRPHVYGKQNIPKEGALIFSGNHKHAFDPILIGMSTKREVIFLAKKELHQGFKKYFFRALGTVPIDLQGKNPAAMKNIENLLQNGLAVNIFPEAKRNFTSELLLPFKFGAVALAQKTGAKIVPLAIKGNYHLFRKGISMVLGEPFRVDSEMDLTEANQILRDRITKLLLTEKEENGNE